MIDPLTVIIPTLSLNIPEPYIQWAYQGYTELVVGVIESQLEVIPDELNNVWAAWESLHEKLWQDSVDLVTLMGYSNTLLPEKRKELAYGRSLYVAAQGVFAEALRKKNLRLYISTRLDIEKQRQDRHIAGQKLQMKHAEDLITATAEAYNIAVQAFTAMVQALTLEENRYKALVAINNVELKRLEKAMQEARLESELAQGEFRRQRALAGVAQAMADLQRLTVEILLNDVRLQALDIEIQRLGLQALLVGTQIITEQAQALSLQVDAQVIQAEGGIIAVLEAANQQIAGEIVNLLEVKDARDAMYVQILADKQALLVRYQAAQALLLAAQRRYANAQMALAQAQNTMEMTRITTGDNVEDARTLAGFAIEDASFEAGNAVEDARLDGDVAVGNARTSSDGRITAARITADATIIAAKFLADTTVDSAKLGADIDIAITQHNYDAAMLSAQRDFDIDVDTLQAFTQVDIEIARGRYGRVVRHASFDLDMQRAVSQWAIDRDKGELAEVQQEIEAEQTEVINAGKATLGEARVSAAKELQHAKVINRFTEYR